MLICGMCGPPVPGDQVHQHMNGHVMGVFVDVYNCRARLAYSRGFTAGSEQVTYLDPAEYTPRLERELRELIEQQGGTINLSGRYYLADLARYPAIRRAVRARGWKV